MKIIKVLLSILLSLSCFIMPVKADGGSFITDAGFTVTYWLASQGLRFSGDIINFGSGIWDLFKTFLLNKGLTEVDVDALKQKAEQQRFLYDETGKQIMQLSSDLYNYISEFKEWLISQFSITSNSENDKKVIFDGKIYYNDVFVYTGTRTQYPKNIGDRVLGTKGTYLGYDISESGFWPLDSAEYPDLLRLVDCPGRASYYNFTSNGTFINSVFCMAFETPSLYNDIKYNFGAYFLDNYRGEFRNDFMRTAVVNGKNYCYVIDKFTSRTAPKEPIVGIPTFDGTAKDQWANFWYDVTFSPDATIATGEVWGADLGSAPTTVSKDANLITNVPLTSTEEFENFIKNSLVSGWEIATPTDTDTTTDTPSDIADGEVVADWKSIFPFSLPYDYYLLCNLFVADPERPEFPINLFGQTFTYDLSPLDGVIVLFRDGICILFVAGLVWATKEIIQ